jgi:hypothetical protein
VTGRRINKNYLSPDFDGVAVKSPRLSNATITQQRFWIALPPAVETWSRWRNGAIHSCRGRSSRLEIVPENGASPDIALTEDFRETGENAEIS